MNTTINERTARIVVEKGLNYTKFGRLIGVHPNNVGQVCNNKNQPGYEFIKAVLEHFPEIDPLWYVLGIGDMIKDDDKEERELIQVLKRENENLIKDKEELRLDKQRLYRIIEHGGLMGNFLSPVPSAKMIEMFPDEKEEEKEVA